MELKKFIDLNYSGSVLEFCRANGINNTTTVYQWIKAKQPYEIINGRLKQDKGREVV